jgi:hypothetical protein
MILLEPYFGAMHIASNAFSNAVILFPNDCCNPFSTKDTVDGITRPALDKMAICPHDKEIMLVYHS